MKSILSKEDGLIGFSIDPFNEIHPFDQTEINKTSAIRPMSEEYINKLKVFNFYDSDQECCDMENFEAKKSQKRDG